jgi:salicylate hydroxylase
MQPAPLYQGANQSLQDAWCIAECLSRVQVGGGGGSSGSSGGGGESSSTREQGVTTSTYASVKEALEAYEGIRKPPTTAIMLSSRVIGFVETGQGPVGLVRDVAFAALGTAGVAGKIFLKNAVPVLE